MSSSTAAPTLEVDFSWKTWKGRVVDQSKPDEPLYVVDFRYLRSPHLIFREAASDEVVGTATLPFFSIDTDYELRGRKGTIKALKRLKTSYTHLSYNYSDTETPAAMTWATDAGFKSWNFVCLDERQNAVARYSARPWGFKKLAVIDFEGPKAHDPAAREEIVCIGLSLYFTMVVRMYNIFSLFGAALAKPGPLDKEAAPKNDSRAPPS
ncbi:hypothetical protein VTK73DRAFT_4358 [Phialemonium thermophilum]|uniref:Uncharacterized protein n=1 Tax=Phialemonium thermophilum TaxID=223376 RepID=A0ABR3V9D4_9PEZI